MKRVHVFALVAFSVVVITSFVWWRVLVTRRNELDDLYAFASGGDLTSVRRLAEYRSPGATERLVRLAQERNVSPDSRIAAIKTLEGKPFFDRDTLRPLLWIGQPFDVRHAAAEVLERTGCDERCISATLNALHAIWKGEPTLEVQLTAQLPSATLHAQEHLAILHKEAENDYLSLLNIDVCLTRRVLQTDYSSEPAFIDEIRKKLRPC